MRTSTLHRANGYGLVVIAGLFAAFAVIAAATIDRSTALAEIQQQDQARAQLTRLSIALAKYARYNSGRMPCPASEKVLPTNASFGLPATATCYTGQATSADTPFLTGTATGNVLIKGMVPVQSLTPYGISVNDAFDPWGGRIVYIVHREMTTGGSGGGAGIAANNRPSISDYYTSETITPSPDMALISYGKDRVGAFLRSQTTLTNPAVNLCPGASVARNYENCDTDNVFVIGPQQASPGSNTQSYFDDIISSLRYQP